MVEKSRSAQIWEIFSQVGPVGDYKNAVVSFLYLDYCDSFGATNKDLASFATYECEQYLLPVKGRITREKIQSDISKLNLNKDEYSALALEMLTKEDRRSGSVNSTSSLSELVERLLGVQATDVVLDLGSGYGTFLGAVAKSGKDKFFRPMLCGQEINVDAANISKMLLTMCDANFKIENVNSIDKMTCPSFTKGYVFPPFGMRFNMFTCNKFNTSDPIFNSRTSSEWLFVFRALEAMAKNGRLVALLPEGTLFKAPDAGVRKHLVDNGLIEGIISLPANSFPWFCVKTDMVVFSRGNSSIKLIDAEPVLKGLPTKGLSSHEAAVDVYNAYYSPDAKTVRKEDIKSLDTNLSLAALSAKDMYVGLSDLVKLTDVVDVLRGSPLTIANFKDNITTRETGFKLLTSSNIENGIIDFDSLPYVGDGKKFEKFFAKKGDVVMTTKSTKVKLAVINEEPKEKVIVSGGMLILRPKNDKIDPTYLKMFFDSNKGKEILSSVQKGSIITTISVGNFTMVKVPCPPLDKQRTLSKKYNSMLAVYDGMKKELQDMDSKISNFFEDSLGDR